MALKGSAQEVTRKEHDLLRQVKRTILTDPFGGIITDGNFDVRFDGPYIGQAQLGTGVSEDKWQIMKVTSAGVCFADDTDGFEKAWEDRADYTYQV